MTLYKMTTEDPEHGSDCIQANSFDEAEQIAIESITRLKTELGINDKLYVVIEIMDSMKDLNNPLYENHFVELFV
jgi:hypothetical protein